MIAICILQFALVSLKFYGTLNLTMVPMWEPHFYSIVNFSKLTQKWLNPWCPQLHIAQFEAHDRYKSRALLFFGKIYLGSGFMLQFVSPILSFLMKTVRKTCLDSFFLFNKNLIICFVRVKSV